MRIVVSYPPIQNQHGQLASVSQNRNIQYFEKLNPLLGVVHAQAATWLHQIGHDVLWDDAGPQKIYYDQWWQRLIKFNPEMVVFESTTPVMKFYWEQADKIKNQFPNCIVVMTGYHSMRKPEETLDESLCDVVLRSNHVDFVLKKLVEQIEDHRSSWRDKVDVEGLVIRKDDGTYRSTGWFKQVEPLDNSPDVDRDLVSWENYAYENGNFLRTPGTYATSVIRDCMFGKCTFCRYNGPDLTFSMRSIEKSLDEYQRLIEDYGVKEIFDDSGVWYRGEDARKFARGLIDRGLHKRAYFGFNTRFGYFDEETLAILGKANFRFVLIGMEAADNETLARLNKGYTMDSVEQNLKAMTKHGLHPHLTIMVGYYWQTQAQLDLTVNTVSDLMFRGLARTLQVTICIPLDYTPYHVECIEKGVLLTDDYNDFDMSKVIVKTPIPHENYYKAVGDILGIALNPRFVFKQIQFLFSGRLRDWRFLFVYGWRALRRVRNVKHALTRHYQEDIKSGKAEAWKGEETKEEQTRIAANQ